MVDAKTRAAERSLPKIRGRWEKHPELYKDESDFAFFATAIYRGQLSDFQIRCIASGLVTGRVGEHIPEDQLAELVFQNDVVLDQTNERNIIKLARSEHIEEFFKTGKLRLGTLAEYSKFEHTEIGDMTEGRFVLVGRGRTSTNFAEVLAGNSNYVLCCFQGDPNQECREKFGYDSYFHVDNVNAFTRAIKRSLNAASAHHGKCVYSRYKVIVSPVSPDNDIKSLSSAMLRMVDVRKYFIKPIKYSHQSEYRFVWRMKDPKVNPDFVYSPEAIKFCRRADEPAKSRLRRRR